MLGITSAGGPKAPPRRAPPSRLVPNHNPTVMPSKVKRVSVKNTKLKAPKTTDSRFADLADPSKAKELAEKYTPLLTDMGLFLNRMGYFSAYFRAKLGTTSFDRMQFARGNKSPDEHFAARAGNVSRYYGANMLDVIKIEHGTVTINFENDLIQINVYGDQSTSEGRERLVKAEKVIQAFIPDFHMPTRWKDDPEDSSFVLLKNKDEVLTSGWKSLNFFADLKIPHDHPYNNSYVPDSFDKGEGVFAKSIYALTEFKIDLEEIKSFRGQVFRNTGLTEGSLRDINGASYNFYFKMGARIRYPVEFALWATHCTSMSEFVPYTFVEYMKEVAFYRTAATKGVQDPGIRTMSLEMVQKRTNEYKERIKYNPKPRTNRDGFAILAKGDIHFFPTDDRTAFYNQELRNAYNKETGVFTPPKYIKSLHGIPLVTDWLSEVFVYTGADNGKPIAVSLKGAKPLDNTTIGKYLIRGFVDLFGDPRSDSTSPNKKPIDDRASFLSRATKLTEHYGLLNKADPDPICRAYDSLYMFFEDFFTDEAIYNVFNYESSTWKALEEKYKDDDGPAYLGKIKNRLAVFARINEQLNDKVLNPFSLSVSNLYQDKFFFFLFSKYARAPKSEYVDKYHQGITQNTPVSTWDTPSSLEAPNLPGLKDFGYMPHQASALVQLDNGTPLAAIDISPGGGKTLIGISDIIRLKMAGRIKVAVVICPNILVKEWVNEINFMSRGQINAFPLQTNTVAKTIKNLNMDRDKFLAYLKAMPPNTIFVASINFIKLPRDVPDPDSKARESAASYNVKYGPLTIKRYPQALLMRQLNPDYIIVDESHNLKREDSGKTIATKQVTAGADYVRIASGTLIHNQEKDLPSQFGLLNPAIFSGEEYFKNEFYIQLKGTAVELADDAPERISRTIRPYVSWVTRSRPDWSYIMPAINTQFWYVDMTTNQRDHYNTILNEQIEKIKRDPNIIKWMKEDNDDDDDADDSKEGKLVNALKMHLEKLEMFINCPDNPGTEEAPNVFLYREDLKQEDLVSPKIAILKKIIHLHFNGGTFDAEDEHGAAKDIVFNKSDTKIIVFAYHHTAADHIVRHLHTEYPTLFYKAGDDETLTKFIKDPKYKVLIALETALREGLNLQVASRLVRFETLWSPGAQDQAVSRVLRPDVKNQYNRPEINYDWFICRQSVEMAKAMRMFSKIITNNKVAKHNDLEFNRWMNAKDVDKLPLVRLKKDFLNMLVSQNMDNAIQPYFRSYRQILLWDQFKSTENRKMLKERVAKQMGVDVDKVTDADVKNSVMVPVHTGLIIPGSRNTFVPIPNGATPVDKRNLNLVPLVIVDKEESEDDDDEAEINDDNADVVENIKAGKGDLVWTEYGFGYIKTLYKLRCSVIIPGMGIVSISKQAVFKPTNPEAIRKLQRDMKIAGNKGILFLKPSNELSVEVNKRETVEPRRVELEEPRRDTTQAPPRRNLNGPVGKPVKPREEEFDLENDEGDEGDEGDKQPVNPNRPPAPPRRRQDQQPPVNPNRPAAPPSRRPTTTEKDVDDKKPGDKLPPSRRTTPAIHLDSGIINGKPTLFVFTDREDADDMISSMPQTGWNFMPRFAYRHVKTYQGALNLINALNDNFTIDETLTSMILNTAKKLKHRGSGSLIQQGPTGWNIMNFLRLNHQPPKNPNGMRIYPIIVDGELYVAAMIGTQNRAINHFKTLSISGVGPLKVNEDMVFTTFPSLRNAIKSIEDMEKSHKVKNANAVKTYFASNDAKKLLHR